MNKQEKSAALRRQIQGAIKATIVDHGSITKPLIGSVLKRLENQPEYKRLLDDATAENEADSSFPKGA